VKYSQSVTGCPDCGQGINPLTRALRHRDTCPAARSHETSAADREWFANHPGATVHTRPTTWAERAHLAASGVPDEMVTRMVVRVIQVAPGVRLRIPHAERRSA
jgi:hypothetical protein